jgi:hypothetical protein
MRLKKHIKSLILQRMNSRAWRYCQMTVLGVFFSQCMAEQRFTAVILFSPAVASNSTFLTELLDHSGLLWWKDFHKDLRGGGQQDLYPC